MIEALFNQTNYLATKKAMDATAMRHKALASNIANVNTPNYERIELSSDFSSRLQQAIEDGDPVRIAKLNPMVGTDPDAKPVGPNGNTVQLENEMVKLNQNTVSFALEARLLSARLNKLETAITGKV
ncbi:MAG: flagellar basal body protein [Verrucomicrobia bacterium]|nr:flagellar basal body protein [Verrucomicrobiota bacterium]